MTITKHHIPYLPKKIPIPGLPEDCYFRINSDKTGYVGWSGLFNQEFVNMKFADIEDNSPIGIAIKKHLEHHYKEVLCTILEK